MIIDRRSQSDGGFTPQPATRSTPSTTFTSATVIPTIFQTTFPIKQGENTPVLSTVTSLVTYYTPVGDPSNANVGHESQSGVSSGVVAGVAICCLIVGAILASLLVAVFLSKRHRSSLQSMQNRWNADRDAFETAESMKALCYVPAAPHNANGNSELQAAMQRIKQLERERTAASQFGDTLDHHSEQELLTSATFGLSVYDQTLKQFVMALTVNASASGELGNSSAIGITQCTPDQVTFLRSRGAAFAKENFEDVLLHLINGFVLEKACFPFSPYVKTSEDHLLDSLHVRLQDKFDRAIVARWRCLTHMGTRMFRDDGEKPNQVLLASLSELSAEMLVWSGMDDIHSAKRNVMRNNGRLQNAVNVLFSLLNVIHEEMTSSNYELYMAEQPSLTKTFGLRAQSGPHSDVRIIAEVVTA